MKKWSVPALVLSFLLLAFAGPVRPDETTGANPPAGPQVRDVSAQGAAAIEAGLKWLAAHQEPNGSWLANVGFKRNLDYVVEYPDQGHPGITALAGMAFLAGGNVPGRGKYGKNVEGAVHYILSCVRKDGMITANHTRMYSHAFATLFLAEVYGMSRDTGVRQALERAVQFTCKCQNPIGGWRYAPFDQDSDMSITVCQVMALRAARNIGIGVPKQTIDRAVAYVLMSANTGSNIDAGSFQYQYHPNSPGGTRSTYALTAAGLATLYMAGIYTDRDIREQAQKLNITRYTQQGDALPRIEQILAYLRSRYDTTLPKDSFFFYYGNYYAVQAMFIAGGRPWEQYFRHVQDDLTQMQLPDGSWPVSGTSDVGKAFSTATASLVLQVPYRYLPIFTR